MSRGRRFLFAGVYNYSMPNTKTQPPKPQPFMHRTIHLTVEGIIDTPVVWEVADTKVEAILKLSPKKRDELIIYLENKRKQFPESMTMVTLQSVMK